MAGPEERGGRGAGGSVEAQAQGQPCDPPMAPVQPTLGPCMDEPRVLGLDKFNGDNFAEWSFKMENIFDHYHQLEVMEGTEKRPENDPEKCLWVRKSAQGYLLLGQALGTSQIRHIKPFQREQEKGPKAWAALKGVHAPATAAVAVVLERQKAALRIEEDELVEKGVPNFFDLLTRLEGADLNYRQKASVVDMAKEGAEDEEEEGLAAAIIMEAAGMADTAAITKVTDLGADGSTANATSATRADTCGAIATKIPEGETLSQGKKGRGTRGGRGRGRGGRGGRSGGAANMKGGDHKNDSSDDRFPGQFFFVSTQAPIAPLKVEGFEEPASVGKVTLQSLDYWVIDSGASYSMTPRTDLLTKLEPSPLKHVTLALVQQADVKGMGKAMFKGADGKIVGLQNVLWVANLAANLVSVRRLQKGEPTEVLGCPTCRQAKYTRFPFPSSETMAKAPLDEVVMDVVGPLKFGAAGAEYFLTIVDVYTRMTWVYVLSKKSDVAETVEADWLPIV
ncbi:unnamed protein product [Closterium sp. NIES-54]